MTPKLRTILILVGIVVAAIFLFGAIRSCVSGSQQAAQKKIDDGQSGAFRNSTTDAINTAGGVNQNAASSEDLTRRNREEILNAKGADTRIDPELDAAWLRAACRRAATARDPKCRLLNAHTP